MQIAYYKKVLFPFSYAVANLTFQMKNSVLIYEMLFYVGMGDESGIRAVMTAPLHILKKIKFFFFNKTTLF